MSALPEAAALHWRPRVDSRNLRVRARLWTLTTLAHSVPFALTAAGLFALEPLTLPVGLILLAHGWAIPELYARRGAGVLRPPRSAGTASAQSAALGLLGDLVGHDARELAARTGLALERGFMGIWLVGETGAVLVEPGGRRLHCWCVRVEDRDLPPADRVAHLLLALRTDEQGFATVANLAFSGAPWRLRRRAPMRARPALAAAEDAARALRRPAQAAGWMLLLRRKKFPGS